MTIEELIYVMADPSFFNLEIWGLESGIALYTGPADEVPEEFEYETIASIDSPTKADWLTINVDL